ncbi:MAG: hypothetical protein J0H60_02200 [Rhizobiales bacterium]|jgi:hypothetical protein|nr:hypothetical protein [Hyphomicrobiales bacterium]
MIDHFFSPPGMHEALASRRMGRNPSRGFGRPFLHAALIHTREPDLRNVPIRGHFCADETPSLPC